MKPEQRLWGIIKNGMSGEWHAQRHEDKYCVGIPDVSYGLRGVHGWLELKYLARWPQKATTTVKLDHFTKQQRLWLRTRGRMAGSCFLFLQVESDFALVPWNHITMNDESSKQDYMLQARGFWKGQINFQKLIEHLVY